MCSLNLYLERGKKANDFLLSLYDGEHNVFDAEKCKTLKFISPTNPIFADNKSSHKTKENTFGTLKECCVDFLLLFLLTDKHQLLFQNIIIVLMKCKNLKLFLPLITFLQTTNHNFGYSKDFEFAFLRTYCIPYDTFAYVDQIS